MQLPRTRIHMIADSLCGPCTTLVLKLTGTQAIGCCCLNSFIHSFIKYTLFNPKISCLNAVQ